MLYAGPKKFVESDFVTRMRLKYSTTSLDGSVILTPKAKVISTAVGAVLGAAVGIAVVAATHMNSETTED